MYNSMTIMYVLFGYRRTERKTIISVYSSLKTLKCLKYITALI